MKLLHKCGGALIFYHDVILSLGSYFSVDNNQMLLTKHIIKNTKGTSPLLPFNENLVVYCDSCREETKLGDAIVMCDDCRTFVPYKDIKRLGESLVFCIDCLDKQKQFLKFLIFNDENVVEHENINILDQPEIAVEHNRRRGRVLGPPEVFPNFRDVAMEERIAELRQQDDILAAAAAEAAANNLEENFNHNDEEI
jgi:hypothetical protein